MNWVDWLLWGFASTLVLTILMSASQSMGITRMNLPYLLGTMFTPDRDRAKLVGVGIHILNGWLFSLLYVAVFHNFDPSVLTGALAGLLHSLFVLFVGMPLLPSLHPRMASEHQSPTRLRQLEPPGMLALHYGIQTPVSIVLAHIIFGCMLGFFYRVAE